MARRATTIANVKDFLERFIFVPPLNFENN
jgi:hypothetical protein